MYSSEKVYCEKMIMNCAMGFVRQRELNFIAICNFLICRDETFLPFKHPLSDWIRATSENCEGYNNESEF